MKIFLSWSGEESHQVALALRDWLPDVIQALNPWVSSADIEKGETWFAAINETLVNSDGVGVFCLTRSNHEAPWIAFEAGALATRDKSRVATFLHGVAAAEIRPPLSLFQATKSAEKQDVLLLLETLNRKLPQPLEEARLKKAFDAQWVNLCDKLSNIKPAQVDVPKQKVPSSDEMLQELLGVVRRIERDVSLQASFERHASLAAAKPPKFGLLDLFDGSNESSGAIQSVLDESDEVNQSKNRLIELLRAHKSAAPSAWSSLAGQKQLKHEARKVQMAHEALRAIEAQEQMEQQALKAIEAQEQMEQQARKAIEAQEQMEQQTRKAIEAQERVEASHVLRRRNEPSRPRVDAAHQSPENVHRSSIPKKPT